MSFLEFIFYVTFAPIIVIALVVCALYIPLLLVVFLNSGIRGVMEQLSIAYKKMKG